VSVDHLFIDLETEPSLSSAAIVRTNGQGKVLAATCTAGSPRDIIPAIESLITPYSAPYIIVAVSADKKREALRAACAKADLKDPFKGRAWLDFGQVAWPLALAELVPNRALATVGEYFHVKRSVHLGTLTGDCSYLAEVYWAMARSYCTALGAEKAVNEVGRSIGGEAFTFLRKVAGI
jgi:hypothetical protein